MPGYWPDTQVTVIWRPWFRVREAGDGTAGWTKLHQATPWRFPISELLYNFSQLKCEYKLIKSEYSPTHYKAWYTTKDSTFVNIIKRLTFTYIITFLLVGKAGERMVLLAVWLAPLFLFFFRLGRLGRFWTILLAVEQICTSSASTLYQCYGLLSYSSLKLGLL